MTGKGAPPAGIFPVTQQSVAAAFDWVFAPWIKEMGFTDFIVGEGRVSMRLPMNERLCFSSGAMCGQALMAAIDTAAAMASATVAPTRGTVYQHTHFLRPAVEDVIVEATVLRSGKTSVYIECAVAYASNGQLVAKGALEFAA